MLGPDGRCFGLVDSWLVGRGEGDGLGEEEASRQKGAEGAVKDGGGWKMQKRGAEGAPNEKSAPKAPKNEKFGAEGAEKGGGVGGFGSYLLGSCDLGGCIDPIENNDFS